MGSAEKGIEGTVMTVFETEVTLTRILPIVEQPSGRSDERRTLDDGKR